MPDVNYFAVISAAVLSFLLGGLWYSRLLFGSAWSRESGATASHSAIVFGSAFLLTLFGVFVFAIFLGPHPAAPFAIAAGFTAGLVLVAGSFGINYLFEGKGMKLWLINGGYHIAQYTVIGAILGFWHRL